MLKHTQIHTIQSFSPRMCIWASAFCFECSGCNAKKEPKITAAATRSALLFSFSLFRLMGINERDASRCVYVCECHSFIRKQRKFVSFLLRSLFHSRRLAVCECVIYLVHTQRAAIILSIFIYIFVAASVFFRTATNRRNVDNEKFKVEKKLHVNVCT